MTEPPITVKKWGHAVEMAEAPCGGCGRPMRYNLAYRVLGHVEDVDGCDEPWPHEPMPQWVREEIAQQQADMGTLRRGAPLVDAWLAGQGIGP